MHTALILAVMSAAVPGQPQQPQPLAAILRHISLLQEQKKIDPVTGRFIGRVLGMFVRRGMTKEQVDRILCGDQCGLEGGFLSGGLISLSWRYDMYGLTVSFSSDEKGVFRVWQVSYWPLLP